MSYELTGHARRRMARREISLQQIHDVMRDFSQKSWPNKDGTGTVLLATISPDRELAVVVKGKRPFPEPIKILTVYWFGEDDDD